MATSRIITPATLLSRSKKSAPGWPLTSSRRKEKPPAPGGGAQTRDERPCHPGAAVDRTCDGGCLVAAVAVQHHVVSQQLLERLEIALLGGGEEAVRELLVLLAGGVEPGASFVDMAACTRDELAGVRLARADDLRDPVVGLVEYLAQQERGALLGRQTLEQDEEGE